MRVKHTIKRLLPKACYDMLTIKSLCSHEELEKLITDNTLIMCDIEGSEKVLLDPAKCPRLKKTDMIVESHDFTVPLITEDLIKKFSNTHKIEIIVDYKRTIQMYPILEGKFLLYINRVIDEMRPERICWLRLTAQK